MRTTSEPFISARNEQPTPQYAQVVISLWSGWPASMMVFSMSVEVGHDWAHAPHDTHWDFRKSVGPAEMTEAKPGPSTVNAKVPCTSSHACTQREQTMHLVGSNVK